MNLANLKIVFVFDLLVILQDVVSASQCVGCETTKLTQRLKKRETRGYMETALDGIIKYNNNTYPHRITKILIDNGKVDSTMTLKLGVDYDVPQDGGGFKTVSQLCTVQFYTNKEDGYHEAKVKSCDISTQ